MKKHIPTVTKIVLPFFTSLFISYYVTASPDKILFNVNAGEYHAAEPRATFDKMWMDYDVYEDGVKGMRMHVKFTAYDMLNMDAYLAIYFKHSGESGDYLKDKNGKYNSSDGNVAVYKSINPSYNPAVYDDLQIFMPYSELDLSAGDYQLTMDVKLIYKAGGAISKLTMYDFEYTKPETSSGGAPASNTKAYATFENLWVDYDVYDEGKKGMKIHVKCSVYNMKDVDAYLAIYFETKEGVTLRSDNTNYRSSSGELAIYKSFKPGYTEAAYSDLPLFIPYSEFDLTTGKHDLKMDADIIYKNGDLVNHLKYYEFWISK